MFHEGGAAVSCGGYTDTREQLIEKMKICETPCNKCGEIYTTSYEPITQKKMADRGVCFGCNFWLDYIAKKDDPRCIRIGGKHYYRQDKNSGGFGSREFVIRLSSGEEFTTNDLWFQGDIPAIFQDDLPNNAEFVQRPQPIRHGQGFLS